MQTLLVSQGLHLAGAKKELPAGNQCEMSLVRTIVPRLVLTQELSTTSGRL
jgi:hypothetical protein